MIIICNSLDLAEAKDKNNRKQQNTNQIKIHTNQRRPKTIIKQEQIIKK